MNVKYYDEIVNFLYEENDEISKHLINCYQEYLFNIKNIKSKETIDNIMNLYIQKGEFYKRVKRYFDSSEIFNSYEKVIRILNKLYKEYEIETLKKVNNTRWL